MRVPRFLFIVGIFFAGVSAGGAEDGGAAVAALPRASLDLGFLSGLDRLARGAEVSLALGLAWCRGGEGGGSGAGPAPDDLGLGLALDASLGWDATLAAALFRAGFCLQLGPALSFEASWELPLSRARLELPGAKAVALLEPRGFPCHLAASVLLARRGGSTPLEPSRPSFSLVGELSWTSYRVAGLEGGGGGEALAKALAGSAGFAAGFRASLLAVATWLGPPRWKVAFHPPPGRP